MMRSQLLRTYEFENPMTSCLSAKCSRTRQEMLPSTAWQEKVRIFVFLRRAPRLVTGAVSCCAVSGTL